jgi:excisionase family DNA binding protein
MDDDLLTVQDVATRLKVNPETVRRWLRSGRIKGTLLGDRAGWRIPASEIRRFLAGAESSQS